MIESCIERGRKCDRLTERNWHLIGSTNRRRSRDAYPHGLLDPKDPRFAFEPQAECRHARIVKPVAELLRVIKWIIVFRVGVACHVTSITSFLRWGASVPAVAPFFYASMSSRRQVFFRFTSTAAEIFQSRLKYFKSGGMARMATTIWPHAPAPGSFGPANFLRRWWLSCITGSPPFGRTRKRTAESRASVPALFFAFFPARIVFSREEKRIVWDRR